MSHGSIDAPGEIRSGEDLDLERLETYLKDNLPNVEGKLEILQFPGGFSNLTYLLKFGSRELVLRRPPFGANIKSAHDMGREYRILSRLHNVYPKAPNALLCCDDADVLGAPFYVMERVTGVILRAKPPAGVDLSTETMRKLSTAFVDAFAELHSVDFERAGLGDLGKPEGYIERQISGWRKRYAAAKTEEIEDMESVGEWLSENLPSENPGALIHNDFKYDNIILNPENLAEITAVLDWEMATIGDPLMDLGTTLAYWAEENDPAELRMFGLTRLPGNLDRRSFVERYVKMSGRVPFEPLFYYVYGMYKIAVIIQQILARFERGFTKDKRFAQLHFVVKAGAKTAAAAIRKNRIHELWRD